MAVVGGLTSPNTTPSGTRGQNQSQNLSLDSMIKEAATSHFKANPLPGTTDADGNLLPGADLPTAIASVKSTTAAEFLRQMNKMPLFMTELDETGDDDNTENMALEAIKALQYEGEPWEVALNFKDSGNERFKRKDYIDAREFYTRALKVNCDREDINTACLNNRAQCNLEMRNYRKCITDCRAALKLNPSAEKPWFRAAKALLALDKTDEAQACIDNAFLLSPTNTQVSALATKITSRTAHLARQTTLRLERERRKKWEEDALQIALRARNIPTRSTAAPPEMPDGVKIGFSEAGKPESALVFPVLLIYHLHLQTDMVAGMPETATAGEQLEEVLAEPLPWDGNREYTVASVECYMETKTGGLVKVGRRVSLLEVLGGGKVEVVDGLVRILVVPRARNAEFVEKWKKTMRTAR